MFGFNKDAYEKATANFLEYIKSLPEESLRYRPAIEGAWTIHEHIIHLADSEINLFLRLKSILANPGKTTFVIDEMKWAANIDYHKESIDDYLEILKLLRKVICHLFLEVIDDKYRDNYVIHPDYGKVNLDTWSDWYTDKHFRFHRKLMDRNLALWRDEQGQIKNKAPGAN